MTATASRWWHSPVLFLISSGIRFFLLFVVGFSTGGHISLLLSALSVLDSFLSLLPSIVSLLYML